MTNDWLALSLGFLLDQLLGDPPGWPHPVRWLGGLIRILEMPLRRCFPERLAGIFLLLVVTTTAGGTAYVALEFAAWCHPLARFFLAATLTYFGLAARSLGDETEGVLQAC